MSDVLTKEEAEQAVVEHRGQLLLGSHEVLRAETCKLRVALESILEEIKYTKTTPLMVFTGDWRCLVDQCEAIASSALATSSTKSGRDE